MIQQEKEKDKIKMLLLEEMKLNENKITYQTEPPTKKFKTKIIKVKISDIFNYDSDTEEDVNESKSSVEFHRYLNAKFNSKESEDLLKFWFLKSKEFPILYQVVLKVLAVPATEFESERNFSITGRVCESRSRLSSENVDYLVFIRNYLYNNS